MRLPPLVRFDQIGNTKPMASSISVTPKKKGRPPKGGRDPVMTLRVPSEIRLAIETWCAAQKPAPTRSEAIRIALRDWLTGLGLLPHANDRDDRH